jgi:SAM-dependent methyltransferase
VGTHVDVAGFARAADAYERGRPGYPQELVEWVAKVTGIGPFSIVVDVGAGTGKLTRAVARTGARVIAVEPLPEMRALLRRTCAGAAGVVEVVDGTAAATGLGGGLADCVTVAQALHWFATTAEVASLAELLHRRGHLAVLWNRRLIGQPIQARLRRLLGPHQASSWAEGRGWRALVADSGFFEPVDELHARHVLSLDRDGLVDHVASYAFVPNLPAAEREALFAGAAALLPEGGTADLEFEADAYVYRRTGRAARAMGGRR